MSAHSILPPSSAARRMQCPGSRTLEAIAPREPSDSAIEGEVAHWVAAEMVHGRYDENVTTHNNIEITEEMREGARTYYHLINELYLKRAFDVPNQTSKLHIEERVDISNIHPQCWGTPDCWFIVGDELFIFDYKFGHVPVDAFENWQLIEYASGILNGIMTDKTIVHFYIVQPRDYRGDSIIKKWSIKAMGLFKYFIKLKEQEHLAMLPDAPLRVSSECAYCSARAICTELQQSVLLNSQAYTAINNFGTILSNDTLARELKTLKSLQELLEARMGAVEEKLLKELKKGASQIPYYSIQMQGGGRQKWKVNDEQVFLLGDLFGVDLRKPAASITPNQALKKGLPEEIIKESTERTSGILQLVETSTLARKTFYTKVKN